MKKYLKKSFAVLTCTTMCIQTTMASTGGKDTVKWSYQSANLRYTGTDNAGSGRDEVSTGLVVSKMQMEAYPKTSGR
ncbi:MAG: hypothetical protein ACLU80_17500 [Dorea sp.]